MDRQLISSRPEYKGSHVSTSDKLDRTFTIHAELIHALKEHGCPSCLQLLREVIKKYGRSSLEATNLPISNEDGSFDTSYRTNRF